MPPIEDEDGELQEVSLRDQLSEAMDAPAEGAEPQEGAEQPPAEGDGAALRGLLLESGLWTAFRTRPFSRVPAADAVPEAIFVETMPSRL